MGSVVKLLNIKRVILEFDHSPFVVILITIIRRRKNSDNLGKIFAFPVVHFVAFKLDLMGPNYAQQTIPLQKFAQSFCSKNKRTASLFVVDIRIWELPLGIIEWIRPQNVAKNSAFGRLFKSVDFVDVFYCLQLRRDSSMKGQKFSIDQST